MAASDAGNLTGVLKTIFDTHDVFAMNLYLMRASSPELEGQLTDLKLQVVGRCAQLHWKEPLDNIVANPEKYSSIIVSKSQKLLADMVSGHSMESTARSLFRKHVVASVSPRKSYINFGLIPKQQLVKA